MPKGVYPRKASHAKGIVTLVAAANKQVKNLHTTANGTELVRLLTVERDRLAHQLDTVMAALSVFDQKAHR